MAFGEILTPRMAFGEIPTPRMASGEILTPRMAFGEILTPEWHPEKIPFPECHSGLRGRNHIPEMPVHLCLPPHFFHFLYQRQQPVEMLDQEGLPLRFGG